VQISRQARLDLVGPPTAGTAAILSPEAIAFLADLVGEFAPRVEALLEARQARQRHFDAGGRPGFLPETAAVRTGEWTVAEAPQDLRDRRVEITGPTDRKMMINGLNSGANCFMADLEDATSPTWRNCIEGQINLRDAALGTISFTAPDGRRYELGESPATLLVRPRGWHLPERHLRIGGRPVPAALFDFGLYAFHTARVQLERGATPALYLPKIESHLEARLWNEVFLLAQDRLGIPRGTLRATVLIETLPAAFEMEEILFELREHASGLNCGRWDYIFSAIKTLRESPEHVMPDRGQVGMTQPFMRAYARLLIQTCHRRGAHAMGGMAAQIPIKHDPAANEAALAKVRADKEREVADGHDGTWVAHPGLIPIARAAFDARMGGADQKGVRLEDLVISAADLLEPAQGSITLEGVRHNLRVGVRYLEAWLRGVGCVPLYDLMEDAATAEISRAQLWQWIRHGARTEGGDTIDRDRVRSEHAAVLAELHAAGLDGGRLDEAAALFLDLVLGETCAEFLTLPAYARLD